MKTKLVAVGIAAFVLSITAMNVLAGGVGTSLGSLRKYTIIAMGVITLCSMAVAVYGLFSGGEAAKKMIKDRSVTDPGALNPHNIWNDD